MNRWRGWMMAVGLTAAPTALAAEPLPLAGDAAHGKQVYQLNCRGCHGDRGDGAGIMAGHLSKAPGGARSAEVSLRRSDDDLFKLLREGGPVLGLSPVMPRTGLTILEAWDVVAWLRQGEPQVVDFYPAAGRVLVKSYQLDGAATDRLAKELGKAPDRAAKPIEVVTAFSGDREPGRAPVIEAQDPVTLDSLKPKDKLGYVVVVPAQLPGDGAPRPVALGIDLQGKIVRAASDAADASSSREKELAAFVGEGQKGSIKLQRAPAKGKAAEAGGTTSMETAYALATEAIRAYEKEERDRTWADAPSK